MQTYFKNFSLPSDIIGKAQFRSLGINFRDLQTDALSFAGSFDFLVEAIKVKNLSSIVTNEKSYSQYRTRFGEISDKAIVLVEDPKLYFFKFHNFLSQETEFYKRPETNLKVGKNSRIAKFASISETNVTIGENVIIEDFVKIFANVSIGDNTRIQSGTVIGNDCIQCIQDGKQMVDIDHVGGVRIANDVKIDSNSLVCRHIFNDHTSIDEQVKIGGLSHISHGCKIGRQSILTPNIFLGGGTLIGENVFIGPNATTAPMIQVGNNSRITLGSVVTKDVSAGEHVTGNFAIQHRKFLENLKKKR